MKGGRDEKRRQFAAACEKAELMLKRRRPHRQISKETGLDEAGVIRVFRTMSNEVNT